MKNIILLSLILSMPFSMLSAQNTEQKFIPKIIVTGYAEQKVTPDIINVSLTFGENKEFFGKQNIEDLEQKVIAVLQKNGLDIKKDVSVTSGSNYSSEGKVLIRKTVTFVVNEYAKYYAIARQMDFKGVQSMVISSVEYSKMNEAKKALLPKALENARRIAKATLENSGADIQDIIYVNLGRERMEYVDNMLMTAAATARRKTDDYQYMEKTQDITISVSMEVWFSIFSYKNQSKINN